jgi:hypothetical protein
LPESRLRLRDSELEWREVEGQVLALDLRDSRYLMVNRTGRTLWAALREGATRAELVDALVGKHGATRDRAETDVSVFIAELEARDLIVREQG